MMKKEKISLITILGIASVLIVRQAFAMLPPWDEILAAEPTGQYVGPSFLHTPVTIGKSAGNLYGATQQTYNATEQTLNNAKTAINSTFNFDFNALLSGEVSPGQMELENCETASGGTTINVEDAQSIVNGLSQILREYHAYGVIPKQQQEQRIADFYRDSIVEVYTAARELKAYLQSDVRANIDNGMACVKGESSACGIPDPDGKNEALYAEAKAMELIDNILMVIQKAVAMKAQLTAIKTLRETKPVFVGEMPGSSQEETKEENHASRQLRSAFQIASTQTLAFAAMSSSAEDVIDAVNTPSSSSQRVVTAVLTTTIADDSQDITHPFNSEETIAKMAEIEKLAPIQTLIEEARRAHNTILDLQSYQDAKNKYDESIEEHEKAITYVEKADQCVINYLNKRFVDPNKVWYGGSALTGDLAVEYEQRSGLSAWAIEAYETAKAAETTSATAEDYSGLEFDVAKQEDLTDVENNEKVWKAYKSKTSDVSMLSTSKEEKVEQENRENSLIPWQVGAEASKLLAEDQAKWGEVKQNFPIWTDVKTFYNQYLDGKYENIKSKLKIYTVNDIKALIVASLQKKDSANKEEKEASDTLLQQQYQALNQELTQAVTALDEEEQVAESELETNTGNSLSSLLAQRSALLENIETKTESYKKITDEINDTRTNIQADAYQSVYDTLTTKLDFDNVPSVSTLPIASGPQLQTVVNQNIATNEEEHPLDKKEEEAVKARKDIEDLKSDLETLDKKIAEVKLKSQLTRANIATEKQEKFKSKVAEIQVKKEASESQFEQDAESALTSLAGEAVSKLVEEFALSNPGASYTGIGAAGMVVQLNSVITNALNDLYAKVEKRVNKARSDIEALGDKKYLQAYHEQIVEIHQKMIEDIAAMPLTIEYNAMNIATTLYLYKELLSTDTTPETEAFFVGNPAKDRDLKAPKAMLEYNLPPLRELVHFDSMDFANVKAYDAERTESEPISAQDFLKYGGEVPGIWQLMLQDKPFVEKDFNLKEALNQGCSAVSFYRGGFMPCKVSGGNVVVDVDKNGYLFKSQKSGIGLFTCPYLEMRSGNVYDTLMDIKINFNYSQSDGLQGIFEKQEAKEEAPSSNCTYSELGTLLDADENNVLFFRQSSYTAFHELLDTEDTSNKEPSNKEKQMSMSYKNAMLDKNQIGSFLDYVEYEKIRRKEMEELKSSYEEVMNTLFDMLKDFGFEPSADFDIAKESDYNLVRSKLDSIKNAKVAAAVQALQDVETTDNEVVTERVNKYKGILAALQQDKDELTFISDVVVDNNLDEELKTSKVNNEVVDRYVNKAQENLNKQKAVLEAPHCATY